jgi:hypothetical protein
MYQVMVKWKNLPRAQRLGRGRTVTRKAEARDFRCILAAENAARRELSLSRHVEEWKVVKV